MTLTNPLNQTKTFTPAEFYSYGLKVEKNSQFKKWAQQRRESVRVSDGNGMLLNISVVCAYLLEIGYQIKE